MCLNIANGKFRQSKVKVKVTPHHQDVWQNECVIPHILNMSMDEGKGHFQGTRFFNEEKKKKKKRTPFPQ